MRRSDALLSANPAAPRPLRRLMGRIALSFALISAIFFAGDLLQRYVSYKAARGSNAVVPPTLFGAFRDLYVNATQTPLVRDVPEMLSLGLPVYDLRIEAKALRALHRTADEVVRHGVSLGIERPDYDGQLCVDGSWVPVRLKLRGLMAAHYNKNHFSFRLKLPERTMIGGMRELNLLEPYDKSLFVDPITHERLAARGLLALRDRWAVVRLNGAVVGLFQEWEHFGRSVADANGRPEGFTYGGDGQLFGKEAPVQRKAAVGLKELLACLPERGGSPKAGCGWSMVRRRFDVERLGWSAAMSSLLGSVHTWNPDNLRIFWDPAWGRFEPIPWDFSIYPARPGKDGLFETDPRPLSDLLLASGPMRAERDRLLWRLLEEDVEAMCARAEERFAAIRPALELDRRHFDINQDAARVPLYQSTLRGNATKLRTLLGSVQLQAHVATPQAGTIRVTLHNRGRSAARIDAIRLDDGSEVALPGPLTPTVWGSWQGRPGTLAIEVVLPAGRSYAGLRATNLSNGAAIAAAEITAANAPLPLADEALRALDLPEPVSIGVLPAGVRRDGATVVFGPGEIRLARTLELPEGVPVRIEPGTTLLLGPDVSLLLGGDLDARGRADAKIRIAALDPRTTFGTFGLLGRRTDLPKVRLHHLEVDGGRGGGNDLVFFTSAFAIHGAVIELRHCTFRDALSDDGVNFKNAQIDIEGLRIERSRDDAFDCDFCRGEVRKSTIVAGGADGFDFSGSDVRLVDNRVQGCNDKGFSIGEHTIATVIRGDVERCVTGAASKDLSELHVQGGSYRDLRVGFARYVKKGTFGDAKLTVDDDVVLERTLTPRLLETRGGELQPTVCDAPPRGR